MNTQLRKYFQRFLDVGAYSTPPGRAACALGSARTLIAWQAAENAGRVRLRAEPEMESYADVYGREEYERSKEFIERNGCYCVVSEYLAPDGKWTHADSIGMCVYEDPCDPFENIYVPDLMGAALKQLDAAWDEVPA